MLEQLVSLVGAALVLAAYAGLQSGRLDRESAAFCLMNFVGSGLLTWIAVVDRRAGFILLEGLWALLSLIPLVTRRS
jgi:hypothetical protein